MPDLIRFMALSFGSVSRGHLLQAGQALLHPVEGFGRAPYVVGPFLGQEGPDTTKAVAGMRDFIGRYLIA